MSRRKSLYSFANTLILIGFLLIFLSVLGIAMVSVLSGGESSGGVIVFIGPIPVAFGWGEYGPVLILIGTILFLLMLFEVMLLTGKIEKWMIENE
ncbi:MAG: TIGR00304 family protein [Thermoprotei archaeon]|nr:MAG: TIGR00304 family protein [Thermoprotei archaeon]